MAYSILVADDEAEIRNLLRLYLENENYQIIEAADGEEALRLLSLHHVDLCILDIMMPKVDGFHVLSEMRKTSNIPVLVLSAKDGDSEKILGLNLGADDYIAKPFQPLEVVARVNSNIRRFYNLGSAAVSASSELVVGHIKLNLESCELTVDERIVELTSVEFKIMKLFMESPGKVFTKQQIYEAGWGEEYIIADNNIMVSISKLRSKLDPEDASRYIKTIRGLGYRLEKQ